MTLNDLRNNIPTCNINLTISEPNILQTDTIIICLPTKNEALYGFYDYVSNTDYSLLCSVCVAISICNKLYHYMFVLLLLCCVCSSHIYFDGIWTYIGDVYDYYLVWNLKRSICNRLNVYFNHKILKIYGLSPIYCAHALTYHLKIKTSHHIVKHIWSSHLPRDFWKASSLICLKIWIVMEMFLVRHFADAWN